MSWPIDRNIAMGQLALAIAVQQLEERLDRGELTEHQLVETLEKAIARFPAESQGQMRALIKDVSSRA